MRGMEPCYICGVRSQTQPLQTVSMTDSRQTPQQPFFPWLRTVQGAPGANPLSPNGQIQACTLCARLMMEQWKVHERNKVPLQNRQYWTKAWYPTDSNPAYHEPSVLPNTSARISPEAATLAEREVSFLNSASALQPDNQQKNRLGSSKRKSFPNKDAIYCGFCRKSLNPAVGDKMLLLDAKKLARMRDYALLVAASNFESEIPICGACFNNDHFQDAWKSANHQQGHQSQPLTPASPTVTSSGKITSQPASTTVPSSSGSSSVPPSLEQAAMMYQLLLQHAAMASQQQNAAGNAAQMQTGAAAAASATVGNLQQLPPGWPSTLGQVPLGFPPGPLGSKNEPHIKSETDAD